MADNSNVTQDDFQAALLTEFGIDPPTDDATPPAVPTPGDTPADDAKPDDITPPVVADNQEEVTPPADDKKPDDVELPKPDGEETVTEKALREAKEEYEAKVAELQKLEDKPADTPPADDKTPPVDDKKDDDPKFATKDDVIDAMREYNAETAGRVERLNEAKKQVIDILHPEGIDRNIYDTNGTLIKTAQDIVDRGINNERTGEPYTYEEAASFMLEAQKQMNININELEDWAEAVAEKNIDLLEGNNRVMSQWGDILKTLPEAQVKELADEYIATQLKFDKTNQYIVEMAMSPEAYYNRALSPYRTLNTALAEKAEAEAKVAAAEAAQKKADDLAEQAERNGTIPPARGTSDVKSNTGNEFLDAFMDELAK